MKVQVLANFVIECTISNDKLDQKMTCKLIENTSKTDHGSIWVLHVDGASNTLKSIAELILVNFDGTIIEYTLQFNFKASNNQAEYEALLVGLRIAKELRVDELNTFTNS